MPDETNNATATAPATTTETAPETPEVDQVESGEAETTTEATPKGETKVESDPMADVARAILLGSPPKAPESKTDEVPQFSLPQSVVEQAVTDFGETIKPVLTGIEKSVAEAIRQRDERIARLEGSNRQREAEVAAQAQRAVNKMLADVDSSVYGDDKGQTPQQSFAAQQVIALAQELQSRVNGRGGFLSDDKALRAAHAAIFSGTNQAQSKKSEAVKARAGQVMPAPGERGGSSRPKSKTGDEAALESIRAWKARRNG